MRCYEPIEKVRFQDLKEMEGKSEMWKECPYDGGAVPLQRIEPDYYLSVEAYCLLCGQKFHFIDIVENSFGLKFKDKI